jgi:hypothetical protein
MMARENRCGSIIAALGMLTSIFAAGHEANAAGSSLNVSKGGIAVVGGGGAGTDPAYTYQFDVQLTGTLNAYSIFSPPTTITFDNLVGVYPLISLFGANLTGTEPNGWAYSINVVDNPTFQAPWYTSDVTWTYYGPKITAPAGGQDLGVFAISTSDNMPAHFAPGVIPTSIPYGFSIDGGSGTTGGNSGSNLETPQLQQGGIGAVAPEPSTLIAPLLVMLGLPLVKLAKRHRATRSPQAA